MQYLICSDTFTITKYTNNNESERRRKKKNNKIHRNFWFENK